MQANRFSTLVSLVALLAVANPLRAAEEVNPVLDRMNERLAQMGLNVRVIKAELVAAQNAGATIIANDRELQGLAQWAPSDARRNADGRNIRYLVDLSDATANGGLGSAQIEPAIDRAMSTWNAVDCASIPIVKQADTGVDPDIFDGVLGYGAVGTPYLADIVHAGWMPADFFDLILPGSGTSVLAITFTAILLDPDSNHDINGDHKFDIGFCETYYNNHFSWGINADPPVADVESVALHEAGHGLGQAHFGMIFAKDDRVQFAPFAVMNSVLFGQNHVLQGTDTGAHCGIWGDWPLR